MKRSTTINRRNLLRTSTFEASGALLGQFEQLVAKSAYVNEPQNPSDAFPKIKASIVKGVTGKSIAKIDTDASQVALRGSASEDAPIQVVNFSKELAGDSLQYSITTKFVLPDIESGSPSFIDKVKETPDDLEVYARAILEVKLGREANKNRIQIHGGTFELSSFSPFVACSNAFYGMTQKSRSFFGTMQKSHDESVTFSDREKTVETGWPIDSLDPENDDYSCSGTVGGLGTNMLTEEQFGFVVELYI